MALPWGNRPGGRHEPFKPTRRVHYLRRCLALFRARPPLPRRPGATAAADAPNRVVASSSSSSEHGGRPVTTACRSGRRATAPRGRAAARRFQQRRFVHRAAQDATIAVDRGRRGGRRRDRAARPRAGALSAAPVLRPLAVRRYRGWDDGYRAGTTATAAMNPSRSTSARSRRRAGRRRRRDGEGPAGGLLPRTT